MDKNEFQECVNLPRWGLKPELDFSQNQTSQGVNLPRWGLKQKLPFSYRLGHSCVNLPRWGLKLFRRGRIVDRRFLV